MGLDSNKLNYISRQRKVKLYFIVRNYILSPRCNNWNWLQVLKGYDYLEIHSESILRK